MGLLTLSAGAAHIIPVQIDSIAISVFKKKSSVYSNKSSILCEKTMFPRTTMKYYIIHINCYEELRWNIISFI